ncbi:hypothetical protein [Nocardia stercoris]|uniref:hypothetical protein n=1 Tax=Nocardia stercoris TaxID=2483361 RepID=UPI0011C3F7F4|nr:hypothetical protein [Nocardia stercoris]
MSEVSSFHKVTAEFDTNFGHLPSSAEDNDPGTSANHPLDCPAKQRMRRSSDTLRVPPVVVLCVPTAPADGPEPRND